MKEGRHKLNPLRLYKKLKQFHLRPQWTSSHLSHDAQPYIGSHQPVSQVFPEQFTRWFRTRSIFSPSFLEHVCQRYSERTRKEQWRMLSLCRWEYPSTHVAVVEVQYCYHPGDQDPHQGNCPSSSTTTWVVSSPQTSQLLSCGNEAERTENRRRSFQALPQNTGYRNRGKVQLCRERNLLLGKLSRILSSTDQGSRYLKGKWSLMN